MCSFFSLSGHSMSGFTMLRGLLMSHRSVLLIVLVAPWPGTQSERSGPLVRINGIAVNADSPRGTEIELPPRKRHLAVARHLQARLANGDDEPVADHDRYIAADRHTAGLSDGDGAVVANADLAILPDLLRIVAQHMGGHVPLRVDVDLFTTVLVLEAQLVVAGPLVGLRLDGHTGLVVGKPVGDLVDRVRHGTDHERTIGISLEERDQDLHANARNELSAPVRAGPALTDTHPTGVRAVPLGAPIPGKSEFDPAVTVGVNFLPRRPGDDRDVRAFNARPRG